MKDVILIKFAILRKQIECEVFNGANLEVKDVARICGLTKERFEELFYKDPRELGFEISELEYTKLTNLLYSCVKFREKHGSFNGTIKHIVELNFELELNGLERFFEDTFSNYVNLTEVEKEVKLIDNVTDYKKFKK